MHTKLLFLASAKAERKAGEGPFEGGAQVHLKSGGPVMTVEASGPEWTTCVWFDDVGQDMGPRQFKNEALTPYVPPPPKGKRRVYRKRKIA